MATHSAAKAIYETLVVDTVDQVTITGVDVTVPAAGPAAPPYATPNASRLVGNVLGVTVVNDDASGVIWFTYGRTAAEAATPDTATPADGQIKLKAGWSYDIDLPGGAVVVKLLSEAASAYGVVGKLP